MNDACLEALEDIVRLGREAVVIDATQGRLLALARGLRKLGSVRMFRHAPEQASALFDEAVQVTERLQTPLAYAVTLCRHARGEELQRKWSAAETLYRHAMEAADDACEPLASAFMLGDMARMRGCLADAEGELAFTQRALQRYQQLGAASAGAAIEELERRRAESDAKAIDWSRRALGNDPVGVSRAFGIYPQLGMVGLAVRGAFVLWSEPGDDSIAEISRLRAEHGETKEAFVTCIPDLAEGGTIEQRFRESEDLDITLGEQ